MVSRLLVELHDHRAGAAEKVFRFDARRFVRDDGKAQRLADLVDLPRGLGREDHVVVDGRAVRAVRKFHPALEADVFVFRSVGEFQLRGLDFDFVFSRSDLGSFWFLLCVCWHILVVFEFCLTKRSDRRARLDRRLVHLHAGIGAELAKVLARHLAAEGEDEGFFGNIGRGFGDGVGLDEIAAGHAGHLPAGDFLPVGEPRLEEFDQRIGEVLLGGFPVGRKNRKLNRVRRDLRADLVESTLALHQRQRLG